MISFEESLIALSKYFGFHQFRKGQGEVISAILEGSDTVVVMPTGSGKSLCYQLPALLKPGVTVVISPLIALMKDQVDSLRARNIAATFINSSIDPSQQRERINGLRRADYKLVYIAPERFRSPAFVEALGEAQVSLFAIDEAHCISSWGHDFRPDYLRLRDAIERLGRPQTVALTATATPHVRADIIEQLGLRTPRAFVSGFDRPNLAINVIYTSKETDKFSRLKRLATASGGSGIVYTSTRKAVEKVTSRLTTMGLKVAAYHAGLDDNVRERAQDAFMNGKAQIIVATNAFGMGIDKADIRFVTHYQLPGSIEAFYQEIGRAGRDDLPATCELLFNYADKQTQDFFIEGSYPVPEAIKRVYDVLSATGQKRIELSTSEIATRAGIRNEMAVQSSLIILEKAGHIERGKVAATHGLVRLRIAPQDARARVSAGNSAARQILFGLLTECCISQRTEQEFSLTDFAKAMGLDLQTVKHTLALLAGSGLITYRPAHRGRGISMMEDMPGKKLRIHSKEIARRAALEQRKLREMVNFCYAETCYRAFILRYFGDPDFKATCGTCGNCRKCAKGTAKQVRGDGRAVRPLVPAATDLDRFIRQQAPIALDLEDELRQQTRIRRNREESESPNAPGSDQFDSFEARALTEEERIVIRKILAGAARLRGRFGKAMLARVLRGSRAKTILQAGLETLSTYGIITGMTQEEIALYVDALVSAGCLVTSKGAYPTVSISTLGADVMRDREVIQLQLPVHQKTGYRAAGTIKESSTTDQTYALYLRGSTIEEISKSRGLAEVTIESHLADCIAQGKQFDISRYVSNEDRKSIEKAILALGNGRLRPLKDALPEHVTYRMIRFIVAQTRANAAD